MRLLLAIVFFSTPYKSCAFLTSNFIIEVNNNCHFSLNTRHAPTRHSISLSSAKSDIPDEIKKLRDEAERIRSEVQSFEQDKKNEMRIKQDERKKVEEEKLAERNRYSAVVPILKGDGETVMEQVDFPPRMKEGKSQIFAYQAPLPLGMILGEHESIPGATCVDEVSPESNAFAAGLKEGDVLRAVTACQVTMSTPTWQLIAGGIGQPKTSRFMFSVDGVEFEEVMNAIGSNRMDPEGRDVWVVVERVVSNGMGLH